MAVDNYAYPDIQKSTGFIYSTLAPVANRNLTDQLVDDNDAVQTKILAPLFICILGSFRLVKNGKTINIRGGKVETLLTTLALQPEYCVHRERLLHALWPDADISLASQSLHTLIHGIKRQVSDALGGATPIIHSEGSYSLNKEAGVHTDFGAFQALVDSGTKQQGLGDLASAARHYMQAIDLYRSEPCPAADIQSIVQREQVKGQYLSALAELSKYHFSVGNYDTCLKMSFRLLEGDPCREDAHRLAMLCYLNKGQRSQALRHYYVCVQILQSEFNTAPELSTTQLFDQIRVNPGRIANSAS